MRRADRPDNPLIDRASRILAYPYFALLDRFTWHRSDRVPLREGAIVAPNHQSFYDPVLLSIAAGRRVYYMAWDKYFHYPLLGSLMRLYGAVPVDIFNPGPSAYASLVRMLRDGHLCGVFPEGGRTKDGLPDPPRPGVAALALRAGVPIVPVTICGAFRVWPYWRWLPRTGPIEMLFHEPIAVSRDRGVSREGRRARRRELAMEVMLRICNGFRELGRPEFAAAGRRKLLESGSESARPA